MKKYIFISICALLSITSMAQETKEKQHHFRVEIIRNDSTRIPFELVSEMTTGRLSVKNGSELLPLKINTDYGDSVLWDMPVFESGLLLPKNMQEKQFKGIWIRHLANSYQRLPLLLTKGMDRFPAVAHLQKIQNYSGNWPVYFQKADGEKDTAILTLTQQQHHIHGSILTPTGDYRYLDGIVENDTVKMSTFDGVHAVLLSIVMEENNDSSMLHGNFWSGAAGYTKVYGHKSKNPSLSNASTAMFLKDTAHPYLDFSFKDLDGKQVSIKDERFQNKVVVIDLMGSWCPNCMDETAFLSRFYKKYQSKGVEVIGLAYELTMDMARSVKSLNKFRQKFDVTYPMLITGVAVSDKDRTSKTLPQLTDIKMFPTTIFLDKTGKVFKIETGFNGPATGKYYEAFQKEFYKTIHELLK